MATIQKRQHTQGELEAAACTLINRLHCEMTGRGPRHITASLRGRTLLVCLEGVLTKTEATLIDSAANGREGSAVVEAMRRQLVHNARASLVGALMTAFGQRPVGMLHDIAPETDEEAFVFRFPEEPKTAPRRA